MDKSQEFNWLDKTKLALLAFFGMLFFSAITFGISAGVAEAQPGQRLRDVMLPEEEYEKYIEGEVVEVNDYRPGDQYISAEDVTVNADIDGDLYIAAQTVEINGEVLGDLVVVSAELVQNGNVSGNVLVAAGRYEANGRIGGDLSLFTGVARVGAIVADDVRAFVGTLVVDSESINGDLIAYVGEGQVSEETLILGESRLVGNNIDSSVAVSDLPNNIADIDSAYEFNIIGSSDSELSLAFLLFGLTFQLIMLVGAIISGYFVLRVFPVFSERVIVSMEESTPRSLIYGLITIIAAPFVGLILLVSVVGWPLLWLLFILAGLSYVLAHIYVNYTIGRLTLKALGKERTGRLLPLVLGTVLLGLLGIILGVIPILGWFLNSILTLAILVWGIGGMLASKYSLNMASAKEV
ncbi:MAG: hypothetical protein ACOCXP_03010 [Candidatus Dojkabacteria bacterium]